MHNKQHCINTELIQLSLYLGDATLPSNAKMNQSAEVKIEQNGHADIEKNDYSIEDLKGDLTDGAANSDVSHVTFSRRGQILNRVSKFGRNALTVFIKVFD